MKRIDAFAEEMVIFNECQSDETGEELEWDDGELEYRRITT